jgi:hypothetical protein
VLEVGAGKTFELDLKTFGYPNPVNPVNPVSPSV